MNAIATATTQDTGEVIDGVTVLGDYHMNGGYDWMELIEAVMVGPGPVALCHGRGHPDR